MGVLNAPMRILPLVLAAVLSAGCLGDDRIRIVAERPLLMTTYAYDGSGVYEGTGSLALDVDADANEGTIIAKANDAVHAYEIRWTRFAGRAPFQSGGLARDLDMWGESGNGSPVFPKVFVYAAAFGLAESRVDGTLEKDPSNLKDAMPAILFVTRGAIRENGTHRIEDAERLRPYDPSTPENAFVSAVGAQAILLLFTERGDMLRHIHYEDVTIRSR